MALTSREDGGWDISRSPRRHLALVSMWNATETPPNVIKKDKKKLINSSFITEDAGDGAVNKLKD